jgi:glucan 1,3-beta-glucosidase
MNAFTIAPINEASDNFAGFGSAAGLTINGTNWINTYFDGVLKKIAKVVRSTNPSTQLVQMY